MYNEIHGVILLVYQANEVYGNCYFSSKERKDQGGKGAAQICRFFRWQSEIDED